MAALAEHEWAEVRREWELSPARGLGWLTAGAGGRWAVSEEAIRRRRGREGWRKRAVPPAAVRLAHGAAREAGAGAGAAREGVGPAGVGVGAGVGPAGVGAGVGPVPAKRGAEDMAVAVDLRARLVETHRAEWRAARGLVWAAMAEAQRAEGFEKAKFAKIVTEMLANLQAGERKAWGLDIDLIDLDRLSMEQLERIAAGKPL